MRKSLLGLLITSAAWLVLMAIDALIALVRGNSPFHMLQGHPAGKYLLFVVGFVLAIGTAIGHASDRIRQKGSQ